MERRKPSAIRILVAVLIVLIIGALALVTVSYRSVQYRVMTASTQACGGIVDIRCPDGYACAYPRGSDGVSDAVGVCAPIAIPSSRK